MARTKQTARAAIVRAAPKKSKGHVKKAYKVHRPRGPRSRSNSPAGSVYSLASLDSIEVNTQQFSVKFDNQAEC